MAIWSIFRPFGIFYCDLVNFIVIWCIFPCFGIFYQEKYGNPGSNPTSSEFRYKLQRQRFSRVEHFEPGSNPTTSEFATTTPML
jgi:hypothetical protein